jgi:hypothetical protein
MRRISAFTVGTLTMLAAVAGCRDGVQSPAAPSFEAPALAAPAPISRAPEGRPTLDLIGGSPDSTAADFVVGPSGGMFFVGNHAVVIPSQSICDPATSTYGPDSWDSSCSILQSPLRVHAEVRRANGMVWVDFKPSLRFAPSTNPARWAWMVMFTPSATSAGADLSKFNILWAEGIGGKTVDETPTDATLRTYVDTFSGISLRRIKHFSGYAWAEGRCDPSAGCGGGGEGSTP